MAYDNPKPILKYALFCRDTEEGPGGELTLKGIVDLIDLPFITETQANTESPANTEGQAVEIPEPGDNQEEENLEARSRVLAELDLNLAFCIAGATPGQHHLLVAVKAPGMPLDPPPPQLIEWEEGILFQRWIKVFRIPIQSPGRHIAAILFDGTPLGETSFLVRFKPDDKPEPNTTNG